MDLMRIILELKKKDLHENREKRKKNNDNGDDDNESLLMYPKEDHKNLHSFCQTPTTE
jgi:hypothetical protein